MSHDAECFSEMGNQRSREPSKICPWERMAAQSIAHLPPQLLEDYACAMISRSSIWFIQMHNIACDMVEPSVFTKPSPLMSHRSIQKEEVWSTWLWSINFGFILGENCGWFTIQCRWFLGRHDVFEAIPWRGDGHVKSMMGVVGDCGQRFGVRIGYSTHCVLTLCTIKGFVSQLRMRETVWHVVGFTRTHWWYGKWLTSLCVLPQCFDVT